MYAYYDVDNDNIINYTDFKEFSKLIGITYKNQCVNMYLSSMDKFVNKKHQARILEIAERMFSRPNTFYADRLIPHLTKNSYITFNILMEVGGPIFGLEKNTNYDVYVHKLDISSPDSFKITSVIDKHNGMTTRYNRQIVIDELIKDI